MHDIDRTTEEFDPEADNLETDAFGYEFTEEGEYAGDTEATSPFNEAEVMEMAVDLLEITDEAELDQFLGNLIKKASRAVGGFMKSPLGNKLGGYLKGALKKVFPAATSAIGTAIGGPTGGLIGSNLASDASSLLGLELEGISPEDQEYEAARKFVEFAGSAAETAALTPPTVNPQAAAQNAVKAAAQKHAPGLLNGAGKNAPPPRSGARRSGRWMRRGRKIVLYGV